MTVNDEDVSLLGQIARDDEHALRQLMDRYKDAVFHFAYRYLGNVADSSEITEATFFRVYQKADSYQPRASVKTWIFSIARNMALDQLRRQKKFRGQFSLDKPIGEGTNEQSAFERIDSGEADPHSQLHSEETLQQIHSKIQELPEKLRFPFIFCVLEDHPYDECAAILRVNRKTVETRIYRARKQLRQKLEPTVLS